MKKLIILSLVCVLFGASVAYGAVKAQEIKQWDFFAQIQTKTGNVFLYKVVDTDATCYVMTNDLSINARTNGANFGISCVNSVVK